jgi:thiamine transporter
MLAEGNLHSFPCRCKDFYLFGGKMMKKILGLIGKIEPYVFFITGILIISTLFLPAIITSSHGTLSGIEVSLGHNIFLGTPVILIGHGCMFVMISLLFLNVIIKYEAEFYFIFLTIAFTLLFTQRATFEAINYQLEGETYQFAWGAIVGIVLCGLCLLYSIYKLALVTKITGRDIAEIGILVAAAVVLDQFAKIKVGLEGGSIGFTMIPLFIIAYRFGFAKGFFAIGLVYGLTTNLLDGYGLASYPFDYLLAYGLISFSGFYASMIFPEDQKTVKKRHIFYLVISVIVGTVLRYLGSTASSIILYGTTFTAGLVYNLYIPISGAIALGVLLALYRPLLVINRIYPPRPIRG